MAGIERRRRRNRQGSSTAEPSAHRPSPQDLAGLNGAFALTASVHDPEDTSRQEPLHGAGRRDGAGRVERPARTERPDHADRIDRPGRGDRVERSERGDRAERSERTDRIERSDRAGRSGLAERSGGIDHGEPDREESAAERGLRGIVGGGSSQITVTAALRARDAARPTAADLAAAEANLVIVRRGWVPREDLPRQGRVR